MPSIKQIVVSTEKLLTALKREYPNLAHVAHGVGVAITNAGAGFALHQIAASAKRHDPDGDDHAVHYHPEAET